MTPSSRIDTPVVKFILLMICRIDAGDMRLIPRQGPLIVVMSHVNFLEVPLIHACLYPRHAVGLAKRETWDNPLFGALANSWEAIAIDRDGADLLAMRKALSVLERGGILLLAPEGTRSGHGRLQKGHGGVVQLEGAVLRAKLTRNAVPLDHYASMFFAMLAPAAPPVSRR